MTSRTSAHPFVLDVPVVVHRPGAGAESGRAGDGSLVVALHGMGMDPGAFAADVVPLLPEGAAALVPRAPYPYEIRGEGGPREGHAWYVYTGEGDAFLRSMERTEAWLLGVVGEVVAREGLDPSRTALLGFSQGGYLAGFVGLRHAARFRGLVVAGGRLKDEALEAAARAAAGFPVLHVHGERDEAVKPGPSRASVERVAAWGVAAEFRSYPSGHRVLRDAKCRLDVRAFLERCLAAS